MSLTIRRLMPHFAAEITGLDLAAPLDDASFAALERAVDEHAVVVLPNQRLDDDRQIEISRRFGALETSIKQQYHGPGVRPEISVLSNVDPEGRIMAPTDQRARYHDGNQLWHSDSSFKPVPAKQSLLSGREVPPEGAETEFADMRAAYDALQDALKAKLEGRICEHSIVYSRSLITAGEVFTEEEKQQLPTVRQALIRRHPATGRNALYIGSHAARILGIPDEEGRALIQQLIAAATRPELVYRHHWRPHDLVIWDNRSVVHRGRPYDEVAYRRVMHRTTVAGDGSTVPVNG